MDCAALRILFLVWYHPLMRLRLPPPSSARLLALLVFSLGLLSLLPAADQPPFARTEDVIYGRKFGTALTLDILRPAATNGWCESRW